MAFIVKALITLGGMGFAFVAISVMGLRFLASGIESVAEWFAGGYPPEQSPDNKTA